MPRARILAAAMIVALALMAGFAQSSRADDATPDAADTLIQACWDISEEARGGSTADMRNGTAQTVGCLEEAILDQIGVLFPDGRHMPRERAEDLLDLIQIGIQRFYWTLYNANAGCKPSCGTQWHASHLVRNADVLEEMIRDVLSLRRRYKL